MNSAQFPVIRIFAVSRTFFVISSCVVGLPPPADRGWGSRLLFAKYYSYIMCEDKYQHVEYLRLWFRSGAKCWLCCQHDLGLCHAWCLAVCPSLPNIIATTQGGELAITSRDIFCALDVNLWGRIQSIHHIVFFQRFTSFFVFGFSYERFIWMCTGTFYCHGMDIGGDCDELRIQSNGPGDFYEASRHIFVCAVYTGDTFICQHGRGLPASDYSRSNRLPGGVEGVLPTFWWTWGPRRRHVCIYP